MLFIEETPERIMEIEGVPIFLFKDTSFMKAVGAAAFKIRDASMVAIDKTFKDSYSEEEINWVITHEIGHVKHKHTEQSMLKCKIFRIYYECQADAYAISKGIPVRLAIDTLRKIAKKQLEGASNSVKVKTTLMIESRVLVMKVRSILTVSKNLKTYILKVSI